MDAAVGSIVSSDVIHSAVDISVLCFNVVHLPSNCIIYVKLKSNYWHNAFISYLMLRYTSGLTFGHLHGAHRLLACSAYASTSLVEILHMIKIIIINIKCYNTL